MDINIDSQIVVQTAAQWAADTDVYSEKRILVTSDVYYTGTDQRKFKLANGVDTWANLDYMPLGTSAAWGGITGTLSDQTDLQTALDSKLNKSGSNADQDIDIGDFSLNAKSIYIKGTGGAGHLGLKHQSSNITAIANESSLGANSSGNPVWKNGGNAIQEIALLNVATDITSSCTVTGWSSFTTNVITQIDLGNVYLINVYISGTSNSGTASVTLPYTSIINCGNYSYAVNNGSGVNGRVLIASGSGTIDWRTSAAGAVFTASGTKLISGQFWVPKP